MGEDRWPDRFAAAMFAFAALRVRRRARAAVAPATSPSRDDVVSLLTIPIVPEPRSTPRCWS